MLELKRMREVEVTSAGVREALREGSLALPPLLAFPADEGVGGCASRTEELLNKSSVTQADPFSLAPRQFEELTAEIWDRLGYPVELTARTRDGGRDIVAVMRSSEANLRFLIEQALQGGSQSRG